MKNENLDGRILDALEDISSEGLNIDSVAMIICLENEISSLESQIDAAKATIRLIKAKKILIKYEGDRSKPVDLDQFRMISRRHDRAVHDLENMRFF